MIAGVLAFPWTSMWIESTVAVFGSVSFEFSFDLATYLSFCIPRHRSHLPSSTP